MRGGRQNGPKCPRCGKTKGIDYTDNFCTWCRYDLRPHHHVCAGCGFRSLSPFYIGCPVCSGQEFNPPLLEEA